LDKDKLLRDISDAILSLEEERILDTVRVALGANIEASEIIEEGIAKGLKIVGEKFENGEFFLMHLISASEAAQRAVNELLKPMLKKSVSKEGLGKIILGTVQGDIHNIGKNIVGSMLFAAGFEVIDLGEDVPAEKFVEKAKEVGANLIGASALLTTTIPGQKAIIDALKVAGIRDRVKTIFGGAACSPEWVKEIGGDGYAPNAIEAVKVAKRLLNLDY
jgi:dimethylamine corrinoid protein